ncbi:MAG: hypothetical protein FIA96_17500 [Betaproteobacteria bacterium]|nr:hypothetical protein [Betaproteobacteria bacterium]
MKAQTIHLSQPPLMSWNILIILISVASFIALTGFTGFTGFTSSFAAVSPAPTLESGADEGAGAPDTRWPGADAEPPGKCPQCGVVAALREIVPADTDGAGARPGSVQKTRQQEVTVRMRDGSHRVFREASPSTWRVGERMIIIDKDLLAGA